jgi:murein endopeptidase
VHTPAASIPVATLQAAAQAVQGPARTAAAEPAMPEIAWRASQAIGAPHAGRLAGGVGLPVSGPGWTTWDPARDRVPNRAGRLYGTDRLVRIVLTVLEGYHAAHPNAPRVVIGDLSRRGGGPIDQHVSHQNGLDVDVYFPRRDGKLRPPARVAQIDRRLAQDLVDRFVAAGAQMVFVGPNTGLRGPSGVVVSYPNHDDHVHVRIAAG